ncbi:HeH/LEM domain-containing protein [Enterococcus sp. AZ150]
MATFNTNYSDLTVVELKALLDERGIDYPSNAKKQDLIDLLEE